MRIAKAAEPAFRDSSGVVLLCTEQRETANARRLRRFRHLVVWWGTPMAVRSALRRLARECALSAPDVEHLVCHLWAPVYDAGAARA